MPNYTDGPWRYKLEGLSGLVADTEETRKILQSVIRSSKTPWELQERARKQLIQIDKHIQLAHTGKPPHDRRYTCTTERPTEL